MGIGCRVFRTARPLMVLEAMTELWVEGEATQDNMDLDGQLM